MRLLVRCSPCLSTAPDAAERPVTPEHPGDRGNVTPMDEDQDDGETPRRSRTQKRAIVTSPSEKNAHPARRARLVNVDVSVWEVLLCAETDHHDI